MHLWGFFFVVERILASNVKRLLRGQVASRDENIKACESSNIAPPPLTHILGASVQHKEARNSSSPCSLGTSPRPPSFYYQGPRFTGLSGICQSKAILRDQGLSWSAVSLGTTLCIGCLVASLLSNHSL